MMMIEKSDASRGSIFSFCLVCLCVFRDKEVIVGLRARARCWLSIVVSLSTRQMHKSGSRSCRISVPDDRPRPGRTLRSCKHAYSGTSAYLCFIRNHLNEGMTTACVCLHNVYTTIALSPSPEPISVYRRRNMAKMMTRIATITATSDADTVVSMILWIKLICSLPANEAGTTIARMVLSALAETKRDASGLNCRAVGGKLCALRILSSGWLLACWLYRRRLTARVFESSMPIDKSAQP